MQEAFGQVVAGRHEGDDQPEQTDSLDILIRIHATLCTIRQVEYTHQFVVVDQRKTDKTTSREELVAKQRMLRGVFDILYQERLSGGYANTWWLLGAALSGDATSVPYVRIDVAPFPVRAAGVIAFAAAAFVVCRALARARGTAATVAE